MLNEKTSSGGEQVADLAPESNGSREGSTEAPPPPLSFHVMGANLDTGNLGVSALFAATVKCLLTKHQGASIGILEGFRQPLTTELRLGTGKTVKLDCVGVRINKTLWRQNHVVRLILTGLVARILPSASWRRAVIRSNPYLRRIANARCVADITGGDSFSDIYGLYRLVWVSLYKLVALAAGSDLVLLPQTYGPFKGRLARALARWIIRRAAIVLSRDREGLEALRKLIGTRSMRAEPEFVPDVAFVLDAIEPADLRVLPDDSVFDHGRTTIGLNVSGLLWNGGYTGKDMFGLGIDYPRLITGLARSLLEAAPDATLLLVPHVLVPPGHVESDPDACKAVREALSGDFEERVFVLDGRYDQSEVKHVIGRCDFFLGSRMHACIAATSQCVPTAPLAYSKKFHGVFESIGVADTVVDLASSTEDEIIARSVELYRDRERITKKLRETVPTVQQRVLAVFDAIR